MDIFDGTRKCFQSTKLSKLYATTTAGKMSKMRVPLQLSHKLKRTKDLKKITDTKVFKKCLINELMCKL